MKNLTLPIDSIEKQSGAHFDYAEVYDPNDKKMRYIIPEGSETIYPAMVVDELPDGMVIPCDILMGDKALIKKKGHCVEDGGGENYLVKIN